MDAIAVSQNATITTAIELEKIAREYDMWMTEVQFWIAAAGAILLIVMVWCVLVRIAQLRRPQVDIRAAFENLLLQGRSQDTAHLDYSERIVIEIQCSLRELVWSLLFERKGDVDSGLPLPNTHDHRWSANRRTRKYVRKLRKAISAPLKIAHTMIKKAFQYTKLVLSAIASATATSLVAIAGPFASTYHNAAPQSGSPLFATPPPEVRIVLYGHIVTAALSSRAGLRVNNHHFVAPSLALTCKALANEVRPVQLRLIEKTFDYRITWLIPDISPPSLLRLFGTLHHHHEALLEGFYHSQALWGNGECRSLVRIRDMGVEICLSRRAIVQLNAMWNPKGRVPGSLRHCDRVKWASELQEPAIEVDSGAWYLVRHLGWKKAMWKECKRLMGVWGIAAAGTWASGNTRNAFRALVRTGWM
ncbi:hypothetical protein LTR95_011578 [Oleoguttula sp. CCFEE 5521]